MLKALELTGFKSFADRTRFDFPDGITVVVGPNGSGKSNIVDAIKWVLGTQSAKSLRGSDMADVIFKGSAVGGRKAANSAEATLVFDNANAQLPVDAPEVFVTRRVYRSGESEYLINRQPCRLKDIKDLFRGTGVGVDAYSLIEQGKVDRMLQASPKDRRAIFEEAAGISRFKAKKVEAERRLARVDQNLVRLKDIVDEVRSRYDLLQNQAEKARRYREMNQRLLELRTQLGLIDHQGFQTQLAKIEGERSNLETQLEKQLLDLQAAKTEASRIDQELHSVAISSQSDIERQQQVREQIARLSTAQSNRSQRTTELDSETDLLHIRLSALRERAVLSSDEVERRTVETVRLESEHQNLQRTLEQLLDSAKELELHWSNLQQKAQERQKEHLSLLQDASQQSSLVATERQNLVQIEKVIANRATHLSQLESFIASTENEADEARQLLEISQTQLATETERWQVAKQDLEALRRDIEAKQEQGMAIHGRIQGARERLSVLMQLEKQQEGIGQGARQLIELAQTNNSAPWNTIRGLVADLIEIDIHLAPLIDVALDYAAETVVLSDGQIIQALREGSFAIEGRVTMIRMDRLAARRAGEKIQLDGLRGVIGRADRLVRCNEEFEPLVRSMLGNTWLVDSLATAIDLSHLRGAGLRFVTAACERIDSDGSLTIGALKSALGLVARRSEMQQAKEEIKHFEELAVGISAEIGKMQDSLQAVAVELNGLDANVRQAERLVHSQQLQIQTLSDKHAELIEQKKRDQQEHSDAVASHALINQRLAASVQRAAELEVHAEAAKHELEHEQTTLREAERDRRQLAEEITAQRVVLAKNEQRLESHRSGLEQLNRDHNERNAAVADAQSQIESIRQRKIQLELEQLQTTSELAMLYLDAEKVVETLRVYAKKSQEIQSARLQAQKRVDTVQRQVDKNRDRQQQQGNELSLVNESIQQLLKRYLDEYQIDLLESSRSLEGVALGNRAQVESETARIRQDITEVGAVNMEALKELDALQNRYETLAGHYRDLTEAKENLVKIIAKINQDSRRLFLETLDAIRQNFQILYRKSFGGGHADIVLEEGEDVLECGVEIVATPPGKTSLSNSLLSGGEKALTAVALIMAIFQFRPSPFCVLDEVDAPFDEANIGRFVAVLKDFLDWTKFIVVTHSKKTMTAANTLYGVTMQESGVSTQVSVRFEDVGDDGEILTKRAA